VSDTDWLASEFEAHRSHLHAVAARMLGSRVEADDAVQEVWLRLSRTGTAAIDNLGGWLTTVVARVSLDMLRKRASRREEPVSAADDHAGSADPEHEAVLADGVGAALIVVLDKLSPAERLAFVLHDLFAVPFDEIGPIIARSPDAAKMLASRARRKVQGAETDVANDQVRQQEVVDAFLAASRRGDLQALIAVLHPDVVLDADDGAVGLGTPAGLRGAEAVAGMFSGRAAGARTALVDGAPGLVWRVGGRAKVVWDFVVVDGKVTHIDMLAGAETLAGLEVR
jgi:RNA polymerase sigma-70 factor (ECF subfamily)